MGFNGYEITASPQVKTAMERVRDAIVSSPKSLLVLKQICAFGEVSNSDIHSAVFRLIEEGEVVFDKRRYVCRNTTKK